MLKSIGPFRPNKTFVEYDANMVKPLVPDELWEMIRPLLPKETTQAQGWQTARAR